ncbi:lipase/esterase [Rhodotorula toruloides]|uniref:Lipase/esterase n=1 Tax=Rhodotorula toruloides TaxID=5286 RepID=A0A511KMP2_RHOTO|nr:lipase/esterase [Rhodotorula toruloides]
MDWEGPRTLPSFWTPSIPSLERHLPVCGPYVTLYRAFRIAWVLSLLPLHLVLVFLSLFPPIQRVLPLWLVPGKLQGWNPQQRLIYPLLRRLIWAVCDVGQPGSLTPSGPRNVPIWAWLLEAFTVRFGGGARVELDVADVEMPRRAVEEGWIKGGVVDPRGVVEFETVPCFWFEREGESKVGRGGGRWRARSENERVILYFVGGGYATGSPVEGSRCFKLARETGLRVVGANFRKSTSPESAFPAALQDALTTYAHLVLDLGYRDIVLAGDSAGGNLSLMFLQYLTATLLPATTPSLVLPTGLLLLSPWCDLTAQTFGKSRDRRFENDIITASMATNSLRAFMYNVHAPLPPDVRVDRDSVYERKASHPWFSPSLPTSLPALKTVAQAYDPPARGIDIASSNWSGFADAHLASPPRRRLRILITTGTAELFSPEILDLITNLRAASHEALEAQMMVEEGEVHAFPLVPEWIPNSYPRLPSPLSVSRSRSGSHSPPVGLSSPDPRRPVFLGHQDDIGQPVPDNVQSIKNILFSSWINILLIAVPLSFASHFAGWGSTADFIISFTAIVPLASLLGDATEQCILALIRGELRIVQTSLLGSILSNLLLVLGCSFLAGGLKFKEQTFQMTAAQASSSLMVLGCSTLVIPAAYRASQLDGSLDRDKDGPLNLLHDLGKKGDISGLLKLSRGTAIILLVCYACYLLFQLHTHHYLYEDPAEHEEEEIKMNIGTAIGALVVVTVLTSFCADYLVGAIDEFAQDYKIPKAFIGLILLPIVGNAAEHVTSVWMAAKGKMEITIGVAIGSSIQIAVGVIPALVIVGWIINQDLTLFFENFETIVLFISVLLVDILVSDGKSHWLEGAQLIALYLVIALAFWFTG